MPAAASSKAKRVSKSGRSRRPVRKAGARSALNATLAEAAWVEADAALAEALADFDEVETASTPAARRAALEMLAQSLARARRKRGLTRQGAIGATISYSAIEHDLVAPVSHPPKRVIVRARGVLRGATVLVKPRVTPLATSKKTARKQKL